MTFFSDGNGGTPSISVQVANLWYDIRDTYIVRFVADGCRKNLPLCDLTERIDASLFPADTDRCLRPRDYSHRNLPRSNSKVPEFARHFQSVNRNLKRHPNA